MLFYRLIVNCDDHGRMDARAPILRARLFPLKTITDTQIAKALQSLRSAAMIDIYEVDGRSYLQMRTWEKHQQVRTKRAKYPPPPENAGSEEKQSDEIICNQMKSNDITCVPNPIQSESEYESNSKGNKRAPARFSPPTVEESDQFFTENGSTLVEAAKFRAYYESNGWKVGRNPMKDWKAAARGWIARDKGGGFGSQVKSRPASTPTHDPHMQRYSADERKATWSAAVMDFDT